MIFRDTQTDKHFIIIYIIIIIIIIIVNIIVIIAIVIVFLYTMLSNVSYPVTDTHIVIIVAYVQATSLTLSFSSSSMTPPIRTFAAKHER